MVGNGDTGPLDGFLDAARADPPLPSGDFMARMQRVALDAQPVAAAIVIQAPPLWRRVLTGLGGWPGAAGLAAACATGLWFGISPPAALDGVLGSDSAALGTLGVDPLSGFDLEFLEG